jgi:hypothetical protein
MNRRTMQPKARSTASLDKCHDFVSSVPLRSSKDEQLFDPSHHCAALRRTYYTRASPSREVQQPFVPEDVQCTNHSVLVHSHHCRQVNRRWEAFTLGCLAVSDRSTNLRRDLIVQRDWFILVNF